MTRPPSTAPGRTGSESHDTPSPPCSARSSPVARTTGRPFQHFRPGFDLAAERLRREQADFPEHFDEHDLYPDARPCLEKLKQLGFVVGIAGNQTAQAERLLRALDLPADFIGTSAGWGVEKPSAEFFAPIIAECGCAPGEIAYVGDRLDNDIRPALAAGMVAVFLRRGPWGYIHGAHPDVTQAHVRIESLDELPERLTALRGCASRARWNRAGTSRDDRGVLTPCGHLEVSCLPCHPASWNPSGTSSRRCCHPATTPTRWAATGPASPIASSSTSSSRSWCSAAATAGSPTPPAQPPRCAAVATSGSPLAWPSRSAWRCWPPTTGSSAWSWST
jgi:HAD superfamily hydrolase (TIGR01549 family)